MAMMSRELARRGLVTRRSFGLKDGLERKIVEGLDQPGSGLHTDPGKWLGWMAGRERARSMAVKVGDRVRVRCFDPETWARGAAEALDGAVGTVTEQRRGSIRAYALGHESEWVVTFDEPCHDWAYPSRGKSVKAFGFETRDLHVLPEEQDPRVVDPFDAFCLYTCGRTTAEVMGEEPEEPKP